MKPDNRATQENEATIIPVIEERVTIETNLVETGRIQISKKVTE